MKQKNQNTGRTREVEIPEENNTKTRRRASFSFLSDKGYRNKAERTRVLARRIRAERRSSVCNETQK